ncbi:hypothetical protein I7I51_07021 [Histoplasma capsulatum]|uniref:Uncharacterized protein n=1 Tax=Ajellomyces capsulatus TaxID=5037 RepID=A0A8A1MHQ9_AJECA|nr:predicted protein [Histoplasma mississippiense (nom. inval.)]EDN10143.1 predicted protein [Histoplasma mississippiense (nom. inval.)]QSS66168.1 hypothetical protein I7I51_07021 [Histoplasma capsulatum]
MASLQPLPAHLGLGVPEPEGKKEKTSLKYEAVNDQRKLNVVQVRSRLEQLLCLSLVSVIRYLASCTLEIPNGIMQVMDMVDSVSIGIQIKVSFCEPDERKGNAANESRMPASCANLRKLMSALSYVYAPAAPRFQESIGIPSHPANDAAIVGDI